MKKYTVALLGAGARGNCFVENITGFLADKFEITAVCDFNPKQLNKMKDILKLQDSQLYPDEDSFFAEKRADALLILTWDKYHVRQCIRAMKMGYDVLLEKPVSDSREEIAELLKTLEETGRKVVVCHELRYGCAFEKLMQLLEEKVIGDLIAIDAMERLVYWHFAQAYVRIQSTVNDIAHPTILAKCSHDLDLIQMYAGAPCETVSSVGGLSFFRKENAPEGATERCLDCPHVETCPYSAKRVYIDAWHKAGCPEFVWPYNKVYLPKPTTEEGLYEGLKTTCYGKCAFRCGVECNEYVVDNQMVQMQFANGVKANLKMMFSNQAGRRINFFGTYGEILMDEREGTIQVLRYGQEPEIITIDSLNEGGYSHGGGDVRLITHFYDILAGTGENRTSLKNSVECHLMGIAAEESRLSGGVLIKVHNT